jgi:predicted phage terminase large subunit-like protein
MKISQKTLSEMEHSLVAFRYVALSNDPAKELPAAKFHHELSDLLLNDRRNIAVEMFRESGKSSYALRTFPLHCLAYPKRGLDFIVIIKQNQRAASAKLKDLIDEYEANPLLRHNLIEIKQQNATAFSVDVKDRDGNTVNVRIEAYGKGTGIRGLSNQDRRPSIVILDDIQDKDDSRSETIMAADWDWFLSDICFLGRSSRIFMIGNNLGEKCVIERCIQNAPELGFYPLKVPVMQDGVPTWPEKDSLESIEKEKADYAKLGKLDIWFAEKMCLAVAEETRIFQEDDYRYYSPSWKEDIIRRSNLFACMDPASSLSPESCYRAITVTAVDNQNDWYLLDCRFGRWDSAEMVNIIFDTVSRYRLRDFCIEKGWWDQVMRPFLTAEMKKRNIFFNVIPMEHAKKGSKLERIKLLQPRFKAHTIYFPDNADWLTEFKSELAGVTKDAIKSQYIDCVDAFAMTEQVAVAPVNNGSSVESFARPRRRQNSGQSLFSIAGY